MATAIPDINIIEGNDPTILKSTDGTISGLENISTTEREGLFAMVHDEARRIFEGAPQELVDATIPNPIRIPIYKSQRSNYAAALHLRGANILDSNVTGPNEIQPIGYRLPEFTGISIGSQVNSNLSEISTEVGHELVHLLTRFGIQAYMRAPLEALAARIEKIYYGQSRAADGLQGSHQWNPRTYASTTGLRPPDFADIKYCFTAIESLYLRTYTDADALSDEQAWKIWTVLNAQALQTDRMPKFADIERVMLEQGEENGRTVLNTASFQPMREGMHHFAFGTGSIDQPGDWARVNTFQVGTHQDFGQLDWQTRIRKDKLFETRDFEGMPYRHLFYDRQGRTINEISAEGGLKPQHDFQFEEMMDRVRTSPQAMAVLQRKMSNKMGIDIQGLPVTVLQKDPSIAAESRATTEAPPASIIQRTHVLGSARTASAEGKKGDEERKRKKDERKRKKKNR